MFWVVQATVKCPLEGVVKQIPTFFLDGDIQGITNQDTAEKVAKDVIDPFNVYHVSIFTEPAIKQPTETPHEQRTTDRQDTRGKEEGKES